MSSKSMALALRRSAARRAATVATTTGTLTRRTHCVNMGDASGNPKDSGKHYAAAHTSWS